VSARALAGIRVVEFMAKGPVPLCTMMLADMGAEVIQVARFDEPRRHDPALRFTDRGKREMRVDLKQPDGLAAVRRLIDRADVLVEGFGPGVMERLGLGPAPCQAANAALVYARITGWGQEGPLARSAGHDINFLAATGALDSIGTAEGGPAIPLNLIADFAGGSMHAAFGICAALLERHRSGQGQVLDIAMTDGVLSLMTSLWAIRARGDWAGGRGGNFLDGGAPHYAVYRTADGRHLAVGAMEAPFRATLMAVLGLPADRAALCEQPAAWAGLKAEIAAVVARRPLAEWMQLFDGKEACVTAVASLDEAQADPALAQRRAFDREGPLPQPAPAPRLSRTPASKGAPVMQGEDVTRRILDELGYGPEQIRALLDARAVA